MIKTKLATLALMSICTFSINAADMKTKIEIKKAEESINTAKASLISSCGMKEVTFKYDWSSYDNYDYKKLRRSSDQIMRFTGALVVRLIEDLEEICTEGEYAEMYKDELSKISMIKVSGHKEQELRDASFELGDDGKTLSMELHASSAYDSKFEKLIKSLW